MQRDRGKCFIQVGCDRPNEGHAQARRELQQSHLAARRTGDKRSKIGCAIIPAGQGCAPRKGVPAPPPPPPLLKAPIGRYWGPPRSLPPLIPGSFYSTLHAFSSLL